MESLDRIREIAERVATSEGLELVEVEYRGRSPRAILRIYIDKPAGVTVQDCQLVSQQVGTILDVEDFIEGAYTLEVSSPGLDRKLAKRSDYERFAGQQVKLALRTPHEGSRRYQGKLLGIEGDTVQVDAGNGHVMRFDYHEIEKANLVVEFGGATKPNSRGKQRLR